jgi:hypothetical protein
MKKTIFGLLSITLLFASVTVWGGKCLSLSRRMGPGADKGAGSGRGRGLEPGSGPRWESGALGSGDRALWV